MKKLNIIYTSDIHGTLYPQNGGGSLLQCVGEFEKDSNTLIIDGGDTLYGTPVMDFIYKVDGFGDYVAEIFNYANYDFYTLGNHDFHYGYDSLGSFMKQMEATCVAANLSDRSRGLPIKPYEVRTMRSGMRVGVSGIVTDALHQLVSSEQLSWVSGSDAFTAAKEASLALRDECDLKILIYHGGFEENLETGEKQQESNENIAGKICRELDFDILLTAHQHRTISGRYYHGTYVMQLAARCQMYGEIKVEMEAPIVSIRSQLHTPGVYLPVPLLNLLVPVKETTDRWLEEELCLLYEPIENKSDKIQQAMNGSPLADFVNHVQLELTGAEISCTSLPNDAGILPQVLKISDVIQMFPHSNHLVVLEVTGEILYHGLLFCASYFKQTPYEYLVNPNFLTPKERHGQYDFFANVRYTILCNPHYSENKVTDVWVGEEPLDLERTYTVAMSDYRASGVGGYECYASCPVKKRYNNSIQRILLGYFKEKMPRDIPSYHQLNIEG